MAQKKQKSSSIAQKKKLLQHIKMIVMAQKNDNNGTEKNIFMAQKKR